MKVTVACDLICWVTKDLRYTIAFPESPMYTRIHLPGVCKCGSCVVI